MTKKLLNSFESLGDIKFNYLPADLKPNEIKGDQKNPFISQNLEAHFSNKGRAGKVVTIIKGFDGDVQELKFLAKKIKSFIGTGGTVKNNEIIIQGNVREKIMEILEREGYNFKRVGG